MQPQFGRRKRRERIDRALLHRRAVRVACGGVGVELRKLDHRLDRRIDRRVQSNPLRAEVIVDDHRQRAHGLIANHHAQLRQRDRIDQEHARLGRRDTEPHAPVKEPPDQQRRVERGIRAESSSRLRIHDRALHGQERRQQVEPGGVVVTLFTPDARQEIEPVLGIGGDNEQAIDRPLQRLRELLKQIRRRPPRGQAAGLQPLDPVRNVRADGHGLRVLQTTSGATVRYPVPCFPATERHGTEYRTVAPKSGSQILSHRARSGAIGFQPPSPGTPGEGTRPNRV
jgi:hypothetical protein